MNKKELNKRKFNWPLVGLFLFALVALAASISIIFWSPARSLNNSSKQMETEVKKERVEAHLWGEGDLPLPVIVDNMKDAWPQEGLEKARVVFEAPVESGITRFLAIFGSRENEDIKIGPVRSARPYFIDWAEEFGTLLAHVGGSDAALEQLNLSKIYNLDEYRYGGVYFERKRDRGPPHNAFTSIGMLDKFFDKVSSSKEIKWNKWNTKDDGPDFGKIASIALLYNNFYEVRWDYHESTNGYIRFVNDKIFKTSDSQIRAKNIVIMKTDISIIDNISRRSIRTSGEGEVLIFQDGKIIEGKWKKEKGFTKFYNKDGEEILFNKGPIWVEVVGDKTKVGY